MTTRTEYAKLAKKFDITAPNSLGYTSKRFLTPFAPSYTESRCAVCPGSVRGYESVAVVVLVSPRFRTFPEISLRGISVRFEGVCDVCLPGCVE